MLGKLSIIKKKILIKEPIFGGYLNEIINKIWLISKAYPPKHKNKSKKISLIPELKLSSWNALN